LRYARGAEWQHCIAGIDWLAFWGGATLLALAGISVGAFISGGQLSLFGMADSGVQSAAPGIPSLGTLACFTLFAICLISRSYNVQESHWIGTSIIACATFAHVGYLLGLPWMYYYLPGISTAMAFHTAAAFECLGAAIIVSPRQKK